MKLRGSWRANTRPDEPQPKADKLKCPAWLNKAAKAKWREVVPILYDAGIVTLADRDVLVLYCVTYSHWEALSREIGDAVPDRLATAQLKNMTAMFSRLATEFGLTPVSRPRISVREEPMDPIAAEFFGPLQ